MSAGRSMFPPGLGAATKRVPLAAGALPAAESTIAHGSRWTKSPSRLSNSLCEQLGGAVDLVVGHCEGRCEAYHPLADGVDEKPQLAGPCHHLRRQILGEEQGGEQPGAALAGATPSDGREPLRQP